MTHDYDGIGSIEDLHQAAREAAGYSDFGSDDYLEGLQVLLDSFEREADLTSQGRMIARKMIVSALSGRLTSEAGFSRYPAHVDVAVERPVFVCGLTRTGSTALHRLLSADPAHQASRCGLLNHHSLAPLARHGRRTRISSGRMPSTGPARRMRRIS